MGRKQAVSVCNRLKNETFIGFLAPQWYSSMLIPPAQPVLPCPIYPHQAWGVKWCPCHQRCAGDRDLALALSMLTRGHPHSGRDGASTSHPHSALRE